MDVIHSLKAKAVATLSKQDAVAECLCVLSAAFIADEEDSSIDYLKAEALYRQYGEAYHRLLLTILQLQNMKYEMEDLGDAIHLN